MIDDVVPDSEDIERPIPVPNVEQEVDRASPVTLTGPGIQDTNPNVGQIQQTPQIARVEINLNNLPIRNENEQDPVMGKQPKNVLGTSISLQST